MSDNKIISFEDYKKKNKYKISKNKLDSDELDELLIMTQNLMDDLDHQSKVVDNSTVILVWLYCPSCKKLEFTNLISPGGRYHNCGTLVLEKEITVHAQREYSIALYNIMRLNKQLEELIEMEKIQGKHEKKYKSPNFKAKDTRNKKDNGKITDINFGGNKEIFIMIQVVHKLLEKENALIARLKNAPDNKIELVPFTDEEFSNDPYITKAPVNSHNLIISEFNKNPEGHFPKMTE